MANAIRTKDIPSHASRVADAKAKREGRAKGRDIHTSIKGKKFSQLTGKQKDELLQVIALEMGLVLPEDD